MTDLLLTFRCTVMSSLPTAVQLTALSAVNHLICIFINKNSCPTTCMKEDISDLKKTFASEKNISAERQN